MGPSRKFLAALALAAAAMSSIEAVAGPVSIRVPSSAKVQISVTYNDGSSAVAKTTDNSAADENPAAGTFKFTVPDEKNARVIQIISLGVPVAALPTVTEFDFGVAGLLSFEPLELFAFSSTDSRILVTEVDVASFLAVGNTFFEGQQFDAVNGAYAGVDGITFHDGTAFYAGFFDVFVDLDSSDIDGMALFTGRALVQPSISFQVPEPGSILLVGLGLTGLVAYRRRRPALLR